MKRILIMVYSILFSITAIQAQDKFFTKAGSISFYSKASIEDIEAHNNTVTCVLDTKTGNIQFAVLILGFEFRKALMQEHFNEDYLETSKYPRAVFKGQLTNSAEVSYTKNGEYTANVKGQLDLHGVTKEVDAEGKIKVTDGKLQIKAEFYITLADYKIKNDKLNNIANKIKVEIDCLLESLK